MFKTYSVLLNVHRIIIDGVTGEVNAWQCAQAQGQGLTWPDPTCPVCSELPIQKIYRNLHQPENIVKNVPIRFRSRPVWGNSRGNQGAPQVF